MNIFRLSNAAGTPLLAAILFLTITFQLQTLPSPAEAVQTQSMDLVKSAQQALTEKGFDPGPADGLWGPKTKKAVMGFQEKEGIAASGELDAETQKLLLGGGSSAPAMAAPAAHASPAVMSAPADTGADVPDSEIAWGRHKK